VEEGETKRMVGEVQRIAVGTAERDRRLWESIRSVPHTKRYELLPIHSVQTLIISEEGRKIVPLGCRGQRDEQTRLDDAADELASGSRIYWR
jgi:hypothetical protein